MAEPVEEFAQARLTQAELDYLEKLAMARTEFQPVNAAGLAPHDNS